MAEHKLNEQWVEEIDGKMHMLKAVQSDHLCSGCAFSCTTFCRDPLMSERDIDCSKMIVIKDLGILNDDGCLPSPWGGYPKIIHEVDQTRTENGEYAQYDNLWCVEIHEPVLVCTDEYPTKQEAIDAWNRRA